MTRTPVIGTLIVVLMILSIAGCRMFDTSPTEVSAPSAGFTPSSHFLMGAPELDDWGAYYVKDGSFLRVDLPVSGAMKVEYSVTRGWTGAVFVRTDAPVGLEIGLITIDGETDVVENICVSYVEGGTFTSAPENVEERVQGDWTHYKRAMDDGSARDWWPAAADFEFSADTTTTCAVEDGDVQWDVIQEGAFDKPSTAATVPSTSGSRSIAPLNLCRNPYGAFCGGGVDVYTETFTSPIQSNDIIAAGGARWCFDAGETLTRTGSDRPLRLLWLYRGGSTTALVHTAGVTGPTCVTLSLPDPDRTLTGMLFWVASAVAGTNGDTRYVTNAATEIVWP